MVNALGIDVEEWYHLCGVNMPTDMSEKYESRVEASTEKMLRILERLQTKATFFVLGVVAERFPGLVRQIDESGHEIASHGYRHLEIYKHTKESFKEDLTKSLDVLQGITSKPVLGYRAPGFSMTRSTLWVIDVLVEKKIQYDCSIFPIHHPRFGFPGAPRVIFRVRPELVEVPPATVRFLGENFPVAGGAFLRFFPYRLLKSTVEKLNRQSIVVNSFLHVREIDPEQRKLKLPFKRALSHYWGLKEAQEKFENLLADFQFAPICKVIKDGRF